MAPAGNARNPTIGYAEHQHGGWVRRGRGCGSGGLSASVMAGIMLWLFPRHRLPTQAVAMWMTVQPPTGPPRVGVVSDDGEVLLALPVGASLLGLLEDDALEQAGSDARTGGEPIALDGVRVLPPVPRPPSVRDGLCFLDHLRATRRATGQSEELEPVWFQRPAFYFTSPAGVLGAHDDVAIAPGSRWFDLELEVGAVVGRGGRDLDPATAESHLAGYTLMCDWSARDLQTSEMAQGLGLAKSKDCGLTLGPALVTPDELAHHRRDGVLSFELSVAVNEEQLTTGTLAQMDWSFGELLAYASRGTDLVPGDVLGSGTVPGGCLVEHLTTPPDEGHWLVPGDVVSLRGDGLGKTRQTVVAAPRPPHRLRSGY